MEEREENNKMELFVISPHLILQKKKRQRLLEK